MQSKRSRDVLEGDAFRPCHHSSMFEVGGLGPLLLHVVAIRRWSVNGAWCILTGILRWIFHGGLLRSWCWNRYLLMPYIPVRWCLIGNIFDILWFFRNGAGSSGAADERAPVVKERGPSHNSWEFVIKYTDEICLVALQLRHATYLSNTCRALSRFLSLASTCFAIAITAIHNLWPAKTGDQMWIDHCLEADRPENAWKPDLSQTKLLDGFGRMQTWDKD